MIYEMSRDVQDLLRQASIPYVVEYGPERTKRAESYGPVILFSRDTRVEDSVRAPVGSQRNSRRIYVRDMSVVIHVYAQSSLSGAHIGDHERECERIVDALLVALYDWGVGARTDGIRFSGMGYVHPEERPDVESWPGVIFAIRFFVPRSVNRLRYTSEQAVGAAQAEGSPTGVANNTRVVLRGSNGEPEIGCG